MKIWVIKHFFMTKYFICSILFLALMIGVSSTGSAANPTITEASVSDINRDGNKLPANTAAETPVKSMPLGASPHVPVEKGSGHTPSMDETPHIHHFHKHRVKKLKRHRKYWLLSQLLIIACHAALLLIAYLHAVH